MARLGEYTIDGGIYFTIGTTETNYLLDSTAETAAAAADFVIASIALSTTAATLRFDCQNDSGSGSLATAGTGTTTAGNVVHSLQVGRILMLPASLFSTAQATRHGRAIASSANTLFFLQFCSWV